MYLGAYHFAGDPADLVSAYDRMMAGFPTDELILHLCAVGPDGIVVLDACPTEADHLAFSTSVGFRRACDEAGLPAPTVEHLGPVHRSIIRQGVDR